MFSTTLIATVFVFGLLIFVHELGHFLSAKSVGMRVDEFALGFGPKLFQRKKGETVYSLRIVPLGGFNKIAGMDPDEEQDGQSFNAKPIWARMFVIVAGSAMNFILPILLFIFIFFTAGIDQPSNQAVVGSVFPNKPAANAGFMPGDRIISINHNKIDTWRDFVSNVQGNAGNQLVIQYERNGTTQEASVIPEYDEKGKRGIVGVMPKIDTYHPGLFEAIGLSFKYTYTISVSMVVGIVQMITGQIAADVAGPIGVAQMAGEVAQQGLVRLLQFAAFLSINLGLINLLPVPVLDGGHVVTLAVEAVRGKPMSKEKLQFIQMIGFVLLMLLMVFATFKDIARITF